MKKTKTTLIVCTLALMACAALLTACGGGGVSPREKALEMEVSALQTELAAADNMPSAAAPSAPLTATPAPTIDSSTLPAVAGLASRIDTFMRSQSSFSGAILVAQKGQVQISQGYGLANRELDMPNTPQTKFAIGTLTKPFTAMAVMILQERRKLSVQDPLCNYIKDCPAAWKAVTLRHLLTHTSGIPNYTASYIAEKINVCQQYTPDEVIAYFKSLPLDFAPGDHWVDSDSEYFLLGMVIEKASGESYEKFIQESIFQPLGMSDSGYDHANLIVKNRASGYSLDQNILKFVNVPCRDASLNYAAAGLYSTLEDLYKWDQALYTDQLVSKDTLKAIFTSTVAVPSILATDMVYGYGWEISHQSGRLVIGHAGRVPGFRAQLLRYPDDQATIIVLSNLDSLDLGVINKALADITLGAK
ncbi:MAG: serine hydrolase domain-containing protein [Anaerolineales bacterium]